MLYRIRTKYRLWCHISPAHKSWWQLQNTKMHCIIILHVCVCLHSALCLYVQSLPPCLCPLVAVVMHSDPGLLSPAVDALLGCSLSILVRCALRWQAWAPWWVDCCTVGGRWERERERERERKGEREKRREKEREGEHDLRTLCLTTATNWLYTICSLTFTWLRK